MSLKNLLIGVMLVTLGTTLAVTSCFKVYDNSQASFPAADVFPIQANSSSDFYFPSVYFSNAYGPLPQTLKILVMVGGSYELNGVLNSTLNYTSTMAFGKNITISLSHGDQTLTASERPFGYFLVNSVGPAAVHYFDVPNDWGQGTKVTITNPENYPVCWIVNVILYRQTINVSWLIVLFSGLVPAVLGVILLRVELRKRNVTAEKM